MGSRLPNSNSDNALSLSDSALSLTVRGGSSVPLPQSRLPLAIEYPPDAEPEIPVFTCDHLRRRAERVSRPVQFRPQLYSGFMSVPCLANGPAFGCPISSRWSARMPAAYQQRWFNRNKHPRITSVVIVAITSLHRLVDKVRSPRHQHAASISLQSLGVHTTATTPHGGTRRAMPSARASVGCDRTSTRRRPGRRRGRG